MNNQKKNNGKNPLAALLSRRQFRYGGYATVLIAVVVAVVILLNVAIGAIEDNWALTIDMSAIGATDFDEQTIKIVNAVDEPVHIYTLYSTVATSSLRIHTEEVINRYRAMNDNLTVENIDPSAEPARVNGYTGGVTLSDGSIIVTNADETRVKVIDTKDYYIEANYNGQTYTLFALEPILTSSLLYVTSDSTPRIFFLTGHGEIDGLSKATLVVDQLKSRNYDVFSLNLLNDKDVELKAGDTVVVFSPNRDMTDEEYVILRDWLAKGGRMMFLLNYEIDSSVLVNFSRLLDYYQLSFGEGTVVESNAATSNWNGNTYTLAPNMNKEHQITAELLASTPNAYLTVPYGRPINPVLMPESGLEFTNILTTSAGAVVQGEDGSSLPGTQTVAMTMIKPDTANPDNDIRIALLGSVYLLGDSSLMYSSYNMDFVLNAFDWLSNTQNENIVSVSAKLMQYNTLAISDIGTAYTLGGIVIGVIPLIVLIAGVVVWLKRRTL